MNKVVKVLLGLTGIVTPVAFILFIDSIGLSVVWNPNTFFGSITSLIRGIFPLPFLIISITYGVFILNAYGLESTKYRLILLILFIQLSLLTGALLLIGIWIDSEVLITTITVGIFHWILLIVHWITFRRLLSWRYRVGMVAGILGIVFLGGSWITSIVKTQSLCWHNDPKCIGQKIVDSNIDNWQLCASQSRPINCYRETAIRSKNLEICKIAPMPEDSRDACFLWYGIQNKDPNACSFMQGWSADWSKDMSLWQIQCCRGAYDLDEYNGVLNQQQKEKCNIRQ